METESEVTGEAASDIFDAVETGADIVRSVGDIQEEKQHQIDELMRRLDDH